MSASTLPRLILEQLDAEPTRVVFYARADTLDPRPDPATNVPDAPPGWHGFTAAALRAEWSGLVHRLRALGVDHGVCVAIVAETSPMWSAADLATLALGGVTVGVYPSLLGEAVAWQVKHCEARVLLVEDQAQYDKIAPYLDTLPDLRHVLSLRACAAVPQLVPDPPDEALLRARVAAVQPEQLATIIYTSGTTGNPKGVVLNHAAFDATLKNSVKAIPLAPGESSVCFLPLAHVLQRFTLYQGVILRLVGYYAPSLKELPEVFAVARPTVFATVPRMLEKIKATAEAKAAERGPRAAAILAWAIGVGKAYQHGRRTGRVPLTVRIQHLLADRLVYGKVRARMGGRMKLMVSGGAALNVEVAEWFEALGIPIREAWGLSETCAPATVVRLDEYRPGSVGRAIDGVEIKLDTDGEVLVRSAGMFQGYFKDPEATAAVFTPDGYFRTGDIGTLDEQGFLRIVDRKKEIIVTAGGKNIAPVNLEKKLEGGLLGQAVVIGSERPYLVALLAPDPEVLAAMAEERGWPGDYRERAARPEVRELLARRVEELNRGVPGFESIKRFAVLPAPLTPETGELTPTLKLKRRVIADKYGTLIEELYR